MVCANRLGGPGTSLAGPSRGAITLVASWPNGENLGPEATLATNPRASGQSGHEVRTTSVAIHSSTTMPATERAAYSFTGFGNVSNLLTPILISLSFPPVPGARSAAGGIW